MFTATLLALLCVGNVLAGPFTSPMMVHERRSASAQWTATRPLDPEAIVPLRIALKQGNLHLAEEKLYSVSDPSSPKYGQHWSHKEIADFFAPSDASVEAVRTWLHEEGIHSDRVRVSNSKGWLHVDVSASDAGRLLDTSFHLYQHDEGHHHIGKLCDSAFSELSAYRVPPLSEKDATSTPSPRTSNTISISSCLLSTLPSKVQSNPRPEHMLQSGTPEGALPRHLSSQEPPLIQIASPCLQIVSSHSITLLERPRK